MQKQQDMKQMYEELEKYKNFYDEYEKQYSEKSKNFEVEQWQKLYLDFVTFETEKSQYLNIPIDDLSSRVKAFVLCNGAKNFVLQVQQARSTPVKSPAQKRPLSGKHAEQSAPKKSKLCIPTIIINSTPHLMVKYVEMKKLCLNPFIPMQVVKLNSHAIDALKAKLEQAGATEFEDVEMVAPLCLCPVEMNRRLLVPNVTFSSVLSLSLSKVSSTPSPMKRTITAPPQADDNSDDDEETSDNDEATSSTKELNGITIGKTLYVRGIDVACAMGHQKMYFYNKLEKKIPKEDILLVKQERATVLNNAIRAQAAKKYFYAKKPSQSFTLCTFNSVQKKIDDSLTCVSRVSLARL